MEEIEEPALVYTDTAQYLADFGVALPMWDAAIDEQIKAPIRPHNTPPRHTPPHHTTPRHTTPHPTVPSPYSTQLYPTSPHLHSHRLLTVRTSQQSTRR